MKAGRKCGNNMAYKIVDKVKYADGVSLEPLCILECTCLPVENQLERNETATPTLTQRSVTEQFSAHPTTQKAQRGVSRIKVERQKLMDVASQFLAEVPVSKACSGRNCVLGELITDSLCSLTDHKCGPNMVFKTLIGPMRVKAGLSSYKICFQQCTCYSSEYKKKGGQCIKKSSVPMRNETELSETRANCVGRSCEQIRNILCTLRGRKCGDNMVYKTIRRLVYIDDSPEICILQCICVSKKYVEKDGRCILRE
ncbi:unnamed protein product [Dracunculus medinensis]|uniref:CTCK domain-containing protein n=1 Tax=Dracunculus medinensis TaxID=318479 RepID=A0A158Q6M5_DRAME|nr:unnamed protein product [Dracunculus medinensis]